jgi:hypothetical protein
MAPRGLTDGGDTDGGDDGREDDGIPDSLHGMRLAATTLLHPDSDATV